jgi:hypothetical protein
MLKKRQAGVKKKEEKEARGKKEERLITYM